MARITSMEVRCRHCRKWFPSQITFSDMDTFKNLKSFSGNIVVCPHCKKDTECGKDTVRVVAEDGETYTGAMCADGA